MGLLKNNDQVESLNIYTMKTKLLIIAVLIATIISIESCAQKDLIDCAYKADEEACERFDEENSLESTMYQTPDSVRVNEQKLPSLD